MENTEQSSPPEAKEASPEWLKLEKEIDTSPSNYGYFIQIAEKLIKGEEIPPDESELFWSQEEAKKVGHLLVSLPTTGIIETEAEKEIEESPEKENKESYEWREKKMAETIQRIVLALLEKSGFPTSTYPRGGSRKEEAKSNYSQDETFENEKYGLLTYEEGGPRMISSIFAPQYQEGRDLSDQRTKRGLAHEIMHVIRAQINRYIWENYQKEASNANLEKAKVKGFKVGSNRLGSEAIGELMGILVEETDKKGKVPTIDDIVGPFEDKLKERLEKFKEEVKENPGKKIKRTNYLVANIALLHHLRQLSKLGFGDIPISRLLAIGALGYVSFEKAPSLIEIGIVNRENASKMEKVILEITRWFNQKSGLGFKIG